MFRNMNIFYNNKINVAGYINDSVVDGPGLRFTLFMQGCPKSCKGCHNPQTQLFEINELKTVDEIWEMIDSNPLLDGVTFSGGEPLYQAEALIPLAIRIKDKGLNLVIYTGFTWEQIQDYPELKTALELVLLADTLIDGPFILEQKEFGLKYKGSKNQRIINIQESLKTNGVILENWE